MAMIPGGGEPTFRLKGRSHKRAMAGV